MKKYLLVLFIALLFGATNLSSQNKTTEKIVFTTQILGHGNQSPLNLNSDQSWVDLINLDTQIINSLKSPETGVVRKWRIKSSYSKPRIHGQSTIQIKLVTDRGLIPLFTLPWSEEENAWTENYSNWFQTDFSGKSPLLGDRAISSIRLIAPPGSSTLSTIYKLELEAWDFDDRTENRNVESIVQRASFNNIPEIKVVNPEASDKNNRLERKIPHKESALTFSLTFIKHYLNGDLPSFYNSLNDTLYSLATGLGGSKYRMKPPKNNYSNHSIGQYADTYETKIYSYNQYIDLFPQWIGNNRLWEPDGQTYLFHGSTLQEGKEAFVAEENLVFMCKQIKGQWKIIALPE